MSSQPIVSVLLPVRDAAPYLAEAIASLRAQTLEDFEIIAVDDGSTDNGATLLARWADSDTRVRVIRQAALGIVAALERARAAARGRWLARMDANDVALPDRLSLQLERVRASAGAVACGCRVEYFPRSQLRGGALRYERWLNGMVEPPEIEREIFVECPIAHPTFFLDAAAVAGAGGYRDAGWPEDYDLLLRLWRRGGRLVNVPEVLLRWRERSDRLSRTHARYSPDAFRRCKVHHLQRTLLPGRDGAVIWGAGPTGKALGRTLLDAGTPVRGFIDLDPRKIGQEIYGARVVAPDAIPRFRGALCLAAVAQPGARSEIRAALDAAGWLEMKDYAAVA